MSDYLDKYRYMSVDVAFFIVAYANEYKFSINLTKTQKLLYIAYGANLILGKDRLCNEHPQAWPYGPVFPSTRNALLKKNMASLSFKSPELGDLKKDTYLFSLIEFVFKGFGNATAGQLTSWSHAPNSPWERTSHLPNFVWGNEIPDEYIYNYFGSIIKVENQIPAK